MGKPAPPPDVLAQLAAAFKCPKCRGDHPHVRQIALAEPKISRLFLRSPGTYAFVTCTLCGYTEIYDLAIYGRAEQPVPAPQADATATH